MFNSILENTVLLFVAVDPIALVPIFASLTRGLSKEVIKKNIHSSSLLSLLLLFHFFGYLVL